MTFTINDVVNRGICIGCGACSVITDGRICPGTDIHGMYQADLSGASDSDIAVANTVCPFSDLALNEDQLGAPELNQIELSHDDRFGYYTNTFAGRVADEDFLIDSASGGLTTWLLVQLLERGLVDAVIHVIPQPGEQRLFAYGISTIDTVTLSRKSDYYATTLKDVLLQIRNDSLRYAIVGVPCFIKATRLLCNADEALAEQIRFFIGLVCGGMKTPGYAESMAWQIGISPDNLQAVDFRVKEPGNKPNDKIFGAYDRRNKKLKTAFVNDLVGSRYALGAFQPPACDFCDDVLADTADVTFGDAWLPKYTHDWRGTNIIIIRNEEIDHIFHEGADSGEIWIESLSANEIAQSQAGGLRQRRDGLRVRLADDISEGLPVPKKRVEPGYDHVTEQRIAVYRRRRDLSKLSLSAFADARAAGGGTGIRKYLETVQPAYAKYKLIERPLTIRIFDLLRGKGWDRVLRKIRKKLDKG